MIWKFSMGGTEQAHSNVILISVDDLISLKSSDTLNPQQQQNNTFVNKMLASKMTFYRFTKSNIQLRLRANRQWKSYRFTKYSVLTGWRKSNHNEKVMQIQKISRYTCIQRETNSLEKHKIKFDRKIPIYS